MMTNLTDTQAMDALTEAWDECDNQGFNGGDAVDLIGHLLTATGRITPEGAPRD